MRSDVLDAVIDGHGLAFGQALIRAIVEKARQPAPDPKYAHRRLQARRWAEKVAGQGEERG